MANSILYSMTEKGQEKQYPSWKDGKPNLQTYLDAINKSQPIVQCQYELVWSRWPRTLFFAKNVTIPGISVNTVDINHAGFLISIPTHVTYENNEISMQILADKEGFHYYDIRNMVLQTGHPLIAGDTRATVGNPFKISPDEDTLEIRLRNSPDDKVHHHWIVHNFRPKSIGDIELSMDSSSFVEFEMTGIFTHITYDCGYQNPATKSPAPDKNTSSSDKGEQNQKENNKPAESDTKESGGNNGGNQNGEQGDQGKDLPEDWQYMNENDKKAYNLMKDGMSAEDTQNAIREELKKNDPSLSEDDLDAQSLAAVQNATAAKNTQENTPAPPNNVDTKLNETEQHQFNNEFSNSKPAPPDPPAPPPSPPPEQPSPQPEQPSQPQPQPQPQTKTRIAGEDFDGKSLSQKQMAVMDMGMAMGNSYPPEIMAVYNAQKGKK